MTNQPKLAILAAEARSKAYAPYSKFPVGAALLCRNGEIFVGCNVENISFGLTICAERNAVFKAVAAGNTAFSEILIISDSDTPVSMCGACRQVLAEFCEDLEIVSVNLQGDEFATNLATFLPRAKSGILDVPHGTQAS